MTDFRPERADSRPERADFWSERVNIRPERADVRPVMDWGQTDKRTNRAKTPCVLLGAAAQKEV